jgi:hypothetical protein
MDPAQLKAIEWPKATMGGVEYTFRLSWAARAQLVAWGFSNGVDLPTLAWAAAMAGSFGDKGKWRSAGFKKWLDLADSIEETEHAAISDAVEEALKKASPESTITLVTDPAATLAKTDPVN